MKGEELHWYHRWISLTWRPGRFNPEEGTQYLFNMRPWALESVWAVLRRKILPLPGLELRTLHLVSLVAIPTTLLRLLPQIMRQRVNWRRAERTDRTALIGERWWQMKCYTQTIGEVLWEKPLQVLLSTTNPIWTNPGSNPCLRSKRPATNCLSHTRTKMVRLF